MSDPLPHKVHILWGSCLELGQKAITYEYETEAELAAFCQGVEAAEGWLDFKYTQAGYEYDPENEPDPDADEDDE